MSTSLIEQQEKMPEQPPFTPGPWTASPREGDNEYYFVKSHGNWIAQWVRVDNAGLIAAAPDMLAALKMARDIITSYWPTPDALPEKATIAAINRIDAVIAKATGK
jgi:hypothetical protein